MEKISSAALINNLLVALEDLAVETYKGKVLPVELAELLELGRHFIGDEDYKAPDPSNMCEVCGSDLDELEIICNFCFKEAFSDDLEYDEEEGEEDHSYPERYKRKKYLQFVADMCSAGIPVFQFHKISNVRCPAVSTGDMISSKHIFSQTRVPCEEDVRGHCSIIYPK